MPLLRCDEATVYAAIVMVCGVFLLFAILRASAQLLGHLVDGVASRFIPTFIERLLCALAVVVTVVIFADGSVLLPTLMLLATATSGALCSSLLSFRWLWIGSFICYCLVLLNVVGPMLVEDVDATKQEWAALVRSQHVVLPSSAAIARAASSLDSAASRYVYSFYDSVKIEGAASPLAAAAPADPKLPLDVVTRLMPTWLMEGNDARNANKYDPQEHTGKKNKLPTYHVIASGDNTLLTYYTEARAHESAGLPFLWDSVVLVGQRSRVQHSHFYCLISARSPCLRLHATTQLRNVTIYWAERAKAGATLPSTRALTWHEFSIGQATPQNCSEAQSSFAAQVKSQEQEQQRHIRGVGCGAEVCAADEFLLLDCVEEVKVSALPSSFVAQAPFLVRFGWQFPGYLRQAQEVLFVFSDRVLFPFAVFFTETLSAAGGATSALCGQFSTWLVQVLPHFKHAAEEVAVYAGGLVCGTPPPPPSTSSYSTSAASALDVAAAEAQTSVLHASGPSATRCVAFGRAHASRAAFKAGVQTHRSILAVLSTLADAADVLPGVWTVVRWAWDAEMAITLWILRGLRDVGCFLVLVLPRLVLHGLDVAARCSDAVLVHAGPPLRVLWRWLSRLPVKPCTSRLFSWLWTLETRGLRYEWSIFTFVLGRLAAQGAVALAAVLHSVSVLVSKSGTLMTWYGQTSFSIHLVVTFLQSLFLLLAMRNEMWELIEAEQHRTTSPHSPLSFLRRLFPQSVERYLPWKSMTARANGFLLLVRAHRQACMNYLLLHSIGLLVLIGLSVLPFTSKLYSLTLRYVLPWLSAKAFLIFFDDPPSTRTTAVLLIARVVFAIALQQTIGDFLYHIVKDILIAVALMGGLTLLLWAWPQRTALAKQMATAIADSLHVTPIATPNREGTGTGSRPHRPSTPLLPLTLPKEEAERGGRKVPRSTSVHNAAEADGSPAADEAGEANRDTEKDDSVTKRIDLSEAV